MSDTSEEFLIELLTADDEEFEGDDEADAHTHSGAVPSEEGEKKMDSSSHSQWAIGGNNKFQPIGASVKSIPSGIYTTWSVPGAWGLELQNISSDGIYILPDMSTEEVLKDVYKFWDSEKKYLEHGLLFKRGVLLWGEPGSGKSVTVKILMNEIVKRGGIVVIVGSVGLAIEALKAIRRIEGSRHIVCVFEDIDDIIYQNGEANVLSMLDGEANITNVLSLATTNYPEKLGARIINRPSRFDRRIYIGMPSPEARGAYLQKATKDGLSADDLAMWVKDTKDMSIAHLRELVAAVYCLEQPYAEVIERLSKMAVQPEGKSGFKQKSKISFGGGPQLGVPSVWTNT